MLEEIEKEFGPKFQALTDQAKALNEKIDAADSTEDQKALKDQLEGLESTVQELTAERDAKLREAEMKSIQSRMESLETVIETAREPHSNFSISRGISTEDQKGMYGEDADFSFYADAKGVLKDGSPAARERWEEALGEKAMTEGTGSAGGYLVPDQISSELLQLREQNATLRGLFSRVQVEGDTYRIPSITGGLVAGWVAELAEKPVSDLTFGEISANVFTAAGMAVASNQLLADAKRSVDSLINSDLAKRLANLEELAFLNGTGTNQPRGILNTPGIGSTPLASTDVDDLLDAVQDSITSIYTDYFGAPNAIVMHPRTWGRIAKHRDANGAYVYSQGNYGTRTAADNLPGYGAGQTPRGELFGLPVYTTANVPTNLGATTNESRVIVGNFSEALILDRQGITLDSSGHVFFTTNQTIFRAEERLGFTAARYPKAFNVIGGAGLALG